MNSRDILRKKIILPTANPLITRIYMNSWEEIDDFVTMIRPVCHKVSIDPWRRDRIQLTIKWDGEPHRYDIYLNKFKEAKDG